MVTKTMLDLDDFTRGYLEAMFWVAEDAELPKGKAEFENLSADALHQIKVDCMKFQQANSLMLDEYAEKVERHGLDSGLAYAGHDFYLSRNGHGAGFFDRGLGDVGDKLQEAARACRELAPYLGDDGNVYLA